MIFSKKQLVSVFLIMFAISGCTTASKLPGVNTATTHDPSADFSSLSTYDWLPESPHPTGDSVVDDNGVLHARIRNAIDGELAEKGYIKTPSKTPDFLVGYHVTMDEKTSIRFLNNYYGYADGWGWSYSARKNRPYQQDGQAESVEFAYTQGTLVLDIATAETRELIWRGTGTDALREDESKDIKQSRVKTIVKKLLAQFPPTEDTGQHSEGAKE